MAHMVRPILPEYHTNPQLVEKIIQQLKINGLFDEMRRECLADIDTKPAFQNLKQRVEGHVNGILSKQEWKPSLNKNQLRSRIRESVMRSGILNEGVDRLLHQVFDAKARQIFLPRISDFIAEKGDELKKEFMPPAEEIPPPLDMPVMINPTQFMPAIGIHPDMAIRQSNPLQPPPMPAPMPPLPHPPSAAPPPEDRVPGPTNLPPPPESPLPPSPKHEKPRRVRNHYEQEISPQQEAENSIVLSSPEHKQEEPADAGPVIPKDAVNPLRNLITSLLTSKSTYPKESPNDEDDYRRPSRRDKHKRKYRDARGYSPTIDPSHIEAFTDEERSPPRRRRSHHASPHRRLRTPDEETRYSGRLGTPTQDEHDHYRSPLSGSPPSPYSPISDSREHDFVHMDEERHFNRVHDRYSPYNVRERDVPCCSKDLDGRDNNMTYDPMKFSYERMSSPNMPPRSPPSPISGDSGPEPIERPRYVDERRYYRGENRHDTDMRQKDVYRRSPKRPRRRSISSKSSSDSDSSSTSSSTSSSSSEDKTMVAEVEETVEEIEVVEEYTSMSEGEMSDGEKSKDSGSVKAVKQKKPKKQKKKRSRSSRSSISSGEITSSGELTSDSSSSVRSRPTRPNVTQRRKTPSELHEMEERRRAMQREENIRDRDRPFWANTESSSDYMSSPPRIHHPPYSPPRRPYSPDFHRYEHERGMEPGYGPPPGPHLRDRRMYRPDDFRLFRRSPPPPSFRRSPPPHRYSPVPRMDYPLRPRSPPRRSYSPPPPHLPPRRLYPGDMRPPFPHPPPHHMHRYGSPPHPGIPHRRSSRSPPPRPGMRM